ncbi:MAG: Fe-S protein assembly co-chaperone HscB [Polyangiaceae bacterium]
MDPFAALGIARSYDVDLASAERAHRELSRALHPDKFIAAGSSERRAALAKAVEVNEAWRVVRDPIRRAEALLRLAGVATGDGDAPRPAPDFLMEMLEQREALGEARRARDLQAVRAMAKAVDARAREVERSLAAGFAKGEGVALVGRLGELRFYQRFLDEVSLIEDELAAA